MRDFIASVRRAGRLWSHAPVTAIAVVALTSLGIGSVVSIFAPLYSVVLSPLPLPEPDRLVRLGGNVQVFNLYTGDFTDPSLFSSVFAHLTVYTPATGPSTEWQPDAHRAPTVVRVLAVSSDFFETLGVSPRLGRSLSAETRSANVVVLSDRLWRSQWDGNPGVVGTAVNVGGTECRVLGVMPRGFDFPGDVDAWLPIGSTTYNPLGLEAVARLRAGVSIPQAAAALNAAAPRLAQGPAGGFGAAGPAVQPLRTYLRGETSSTLWALCVVSAIFLLLTCLGASHVLVAHGANRRHDVVVQVALGADRWRIARQFLAETMVLIVAGAAGGLWLSLEAGPWLLGQLAAAPAASPFSSAVFAATLVLVALVTLACGLAPALSAARSASRGRLAGDIAASSNTRKSSSVREKLAVLQLALALALLIGAGVLLGSLRAEMDIPLGFRPAQVVLFKTRLPPPANHVRAEATSRARAGSGGSATSTGPGGAVRQTEVQRPELERNHLFAQTLLEQMKALPEVAVAGVMSPTPFTPDAAFLAHAFTFSVSPEPGPDVTRSGDGVLAVGGTVSPDGLAVLGVHLRAGRMFTADDAAEAFRAKVAAIASPGAPTPVSPAIINDALAQRVWRDVNPIGGYFNGGDPRRSFVVVGVVADFAWTPDVSSDRPAVYLPFAGDAGTASFVAQLRPGASVAQRPAIGWPRDRGAATSAVGPRPARLLRPGGHARGVPRSLRFLCAAGEGAATRAGHPHGAWRGSIGDSGIRARAVRTPADGPPNRLAARLAPRQAAPTPAPPRPAAWRRGRRRKHLGTRRGHRPGVARAVITRAGDRSVVPAQKRLVGGTLHEREMTVDIRTCQLSKERVT